MRNSKRFMYVFPVVLGIVGTLGANAALAKGPLGGFGSLRFGKATAEQIVERQQAMFQSQADMLGVSIEDVKNAWADGKSLKELITEKGITKEQLEARRKEAELKALKEQLAVLVSKGVISQAQADRRIQAVQKQLVERRGKSKGWMGMGMMGKGRHGFQF